MSIKISESTGGFPLDTGRHQAIFAGYENKGASQFNAEHDVIQLNWKCDGQVCFVSYSVSRKNGATKKTKLYARLCELFGRELEVGESIDPDELMGKKFTIVVGVNPDSKSDPPSNTILKIEPAE